jgi:hypothetical protein
MNRKAVRLLFVFLPLLCLPPCSARAEEPVDLDMVTRIREEGFRHSQVMETVRHLTDEIGPRLTGSPQGKEASEWTRKQLADWGLAKAHLEPFEFGRGWSYSSASVSLVKPWTPLFAVPRAYTAGTQGPVRGSLIAVKIAGEADFDPYRGKLAGKILLLTDPTPPREEEIDPQRFSAEQLHALSEFRVPRDPEAREKRYRERLKMRRLRNKFFIDEKVLAVLEGGDAPWGIIRVSGGGSYKPGENPGPPSLVLPAEQYDRLQRLAEKNPAVEVEVDVKARFHDDDINSYNTLAEIPGTDKADELVMAGAHLDSWHSGTGATDNAAGSAVVMEAMRILKAIGVKPRRTIRVALWTGEEQGLIGSYAYVGQHFGSRPKDTELSESRYGWRPTGPVTAQPDHAKLSAYFNIDNGSGKVRGIYAEANSAAAPLFEAWLRPLHDLGADTVTLRHTGGTDHLPFDSIGLPGFQFIQDGLDYTNMTHHTHLDTYDHLEREDLMQAAVVMATFLYQAAMREEMMPRKPLPQ